MTETTVHTFRNFEESFTAFKQATELMRPQMAQKLASQVDLLSRSNRGLELLFERSLELESAGIFTNSPWSDPEKQVPSLVKGTLMSGHPNSSFEILSELRMLAYALGHKGEASIPASDAKAFLEEAVVHNLEFAYDELTEESRARLTPQERKKVVAHFRFLLSRAQLDGIKVKLADEMGMVCAQRPITTRAVRNLIQTVFQKMELDDENPVDRQLQYFVNAIYFPGPMVVGNPNFRSYREALADANIAGLREEADSMGAYLQNTGLTNPYLAMLLRHLVQHEDSLIPALLHLNAKGGSEWERYGEFVRELALDNFNAYNYRGIYGLKRMLERNLFSRRAVRAGLTNLKLISIHPHVERRILKSMVGPAGEVSARQYLLGGMISILGQPIGIGQGNNPTCQSARGISMWAQHSPAKLINMVTTVATANNLIMRFENNDLESLKLSKGLMDKPDYNLDTVSLILVPHLDKIYNEMMRRAAGRGEDPHKWANPSLYGHWVQSGFASAYSYLTNSIQDFAGFVRLFYASFHPDYNGGRRMVYPNPVGIFITSSKATMLGFHAISLLRVTANEEDGDREVRAYFLNPNNEGRQDWGQGIRPSVLGHGERHGESSLPVHEFLARMYAFHYDNLNVKHYLDRVPDSEIDRVTALARASWGKTYVWSNISKTW